jgi:nicotinamide mononucleotide transporter
MKRNVWFVNFAAIVLTWLFVEAIHLWRPNEPALSWLDIIATATGISCVWLTRLQSVLCWPVGIVSCVILAYTYFGYDMPGQAWLQIIFYLPVQFYGWYLWAKNDPNTQQPVEQPKHIERFANVLNCITIGICLSIIFMWVELFLYGGERPIRLWDGSIAAFSVVAQFLLNRKYVMSWWLWMIPVNVSSILFYVYSETYLYALMYVVFLVHSILATVEWHKESKLCAA